MQKRSLLIRNIYCQSLTSYILLLMISVIMSPANLSLPTEREAMAPQNGLISLIAHLLCATSALISPHPWTLGRSGFLLKHFHKPLHILNALLDGNRVQRWHSASEADDLAWKDGCSCGPITSKIIGLDHNLRNMIHSGTEHEITCWHCDGCLLGFTDQEAI